MLFFLFAKKLIPVFPPFIVQKIQTHHNPVPKTYKKKKYSCNISKVQPVNLHLPIRRNSNGFNIPVEETLWSAICHISPFLSLRVTFWTLRWNLGACGSEWEEKQQVWNDDENQVQLSRDSPCERYRLQELTLFSDSC